MSYLIMICLLSVLKQQIIHPAEQPLKKISDFFWMFWFTIYSGDLDTERLNNRNIWITNFYLFAIQMPGKSWLLKPWPEYRPKSLLFNPSPE